MGPAQRLEHPIGERLHADAQPVHALCAEKSDVVNGNRIRVCFDRKFDFF
jgi:hypothetical protein